MSGKDKLRKFRENEGFKCLIQPTTEEMFGKDHPLKGKWNEYVFKNNNPIIIEFGCGKGEYTTNLSEAFPHNNYIGVDIKGARLWKGAKYVTENNIPNAAFLRTRIELSDSIFASEEVSEIWLTFSDPQPAKPRKRLSSELFLQRYAKFLKHNGTLHLKTDSDLLFESTLEVIRNNSHKLIIADNDIYKSGLCEKIPELKIKTFYESMFLAEGKTIKYIEWTL